MGYGRGIALGTYGTRHGTVGYGTVGVVRDCVIVEHGAIFFPTRGFTQPSLYFKVSIGWGRGFEGSETVTSALLRSSMCVEVMSSRTRSPVRSRDPPPTGLIPEGLKLAFDLYST